jgi:hypothetical protein
MRKFSGAGNLAGWLMIFTVCSLNGQNASFKEYVHKGYPPIQKISSSLPPDFFWLFMV